MMSACVRGPFPFLNYLNFLSYKGEDNYHNLSFERPQPSKEVLNSSVNFFNYSHDYIA